MSDPAKLEALVAQQEGFEPVPYRDTQKLWTVGIGRCLETHPLSALEWKRLLDNGWLTLSMTRMGATWLMSTELAAVESQLAKAFAWWPTLNDARQNALINMGYQLGVSKLMEFRQMLSAVHGGDWDDAYNQALNSAWAKQTPSRALNVATQLKSGVFA